MLHFMDMHLPYTEPASYKRTLLAIEPIFSRVILLDVQRFSAISLVGEEGKQYIIDRYDNNLRYRRRSDTIPRRSTRRYHCCHFSDHGRRVLGPR